MRNSPSKCEAVRAALPAHLDDDLPEPERVALARHLEGCAACRAEGESLAAAVAALRAAPVPPAPQAHVDAVLAAVTAGSTAASPEGSTPGPVPAPGGGAVPRGGAALRRPWVSHLAAAALGAVAAWAALAGLLGGTDARFTDPSARRDGAPTLASAVGADAAPDPSAGPAVPSDAIAPVDPAGATDRHVRSGAAGPEDSAAPVAAAARGGAGGVAQDAGASANPTPARERAPARPLLVPVPTPVFVAVGRSETPSAPRAAVGPTLALALDRLASAFDRWGRRYDVLTAASDVIESPAEPALGGDPAEGGSGLAAAGGPAPRARPATSDPAPSAAAAEPPVGELSRAPAPPRPAGAVRVRRVDGRVRIELSGATEEVVPALLARLDDPDAAVRTAVERQLERVAEGLGLAGPRPARPVADDGWWRSSRARAVAGERAAADADRRAAWERWWSGVRAVR